MHANPCSPLSLATSESFQLIGTGLYVNAVTPAPRRRVWRWIVVGPANETLHMWQSNAATDPSRTPIAVHK